MHCHDGMEGTDFNIPGPFDIPSPYSAMMTAPGSFRKDFSQEIVRHEKAPGIDRGAGASAYSGPSA